MGEGVLTEGGFSRADGTLRCDGVPAERIARAAGTPVYVYSATAIREQFRRLDDAFAGVPHRVHYSVKANSNLAVMSLLRELGAGVDIVSGGELHRATLAGFGGADVVFSGVGKTEQELEEALAAGVLFVNAESEGELVLLDLVARRRGVVAPVALRVNPEVAVDNPHEYIRTGERGHKFGIPYDEALPAAQLALSLKNLRLVGLDMHIGSQISRFEPYGAAIQRVLDLHERLRRVGATELHYLDVGGGLSVPYDGETPADVERFAEGVRSLVAGTGLEIVLEPGRYLVANAGVLLTRVLYRKRSGGKEYIITDAGMNDLVRPSHYKAFHRVEAVTPNGRRAVADVVGPVCESGDFFALDRETDDVEPGDLLAVRSAGAYGYVMASNYNSRPRAAEVLVDGDRFAVVTERESYDDLVRREHATPTWSAD
ncbi:MAG TPA: diaminopimelate decarboxylase [Gaiellaceae bacterium]|nr:diaminopimelate decarboxylase [Gaiellaceae bacterium]